MAFIYSNSEIGEWLYTSDGNDPDRDGISKIEVSGTTQDWLDNNPEYSARFLIP